MKVCLHLKPISSDPDKRKISISYYDDHYSDEEWLRFKHPFLLRLRVWLALGRLRRRYRKINSLKPQIDALSQ